MESSLQSERVLGAEIRPGGGGASVSHHWRNLQVWARLRAVAEISARGEHIVVGGWSRRRSSRSATERCYGMMLGASVLSVVRNLISYSAHHSSATH
jgi:hypothetical protein